MFGFAFIDDTIFMSFSIGNSFFQGCFELFLLLIDPFEIFAFFKVDMIIDSLKFVSGTFVEDSFGAFLGNVIDTLASVFLFDFNKCAVSASHFFSLW